MGNDERGGAVSRADRFVSIDGLEVHYSEWGKERSDVVLCLHGFSRPGRDFDYVAERLAPTYRVICPDLPGRGLSQWSDEPSEAYTVPKYVAYVRELCDHVRADTIRVIGTSMGGTIGILLAHRERRRVTHLVLNDSGARKGDDGTAAVERITSYLSNPPTFETLSGLESYYRDTYETFSEMSDAEWRRFTITSARRTDEGTFTPNYDSRTVEPYFSNRNQLTLWDEWESLESELLVLRGEHSKILSADVSGGWSSANPRAQRSRFPTVVMYHRSTSTSRSSRLRRSLPPDGRRPGRSVLPKNRRGNVSYRPTLYLYRSPVSSGSVPSAGSGVQPRQGSRAAARRTDRRRS